MKLTILLATTLAAGAALANPTPNGCETKPIEGSNAFQFVDPTCAAFKPGGNGLSFDRVADFSVRTWPPEEEPSEAEH